MSERVRSGSDFDKVGLPVPRGVLPPRPERTATRDEELRSCLRLNPRKMESHLQNEKIQANPDGYAVVAAAACLQARGLEAGQRVFKANRQAIQRVLVDPSVTGQSYLFDKAAPRIAQGQGDLTDLILILASAQNIDDSIQPYRPDPLTRHAIKKDWDIDHTLVVFLGTSQRYDELQSALAEYVHKHPTRRDTNGKRYFFNSGRPHNTIIAQADIIARLGLYDDLDVRRPNWLRDGQFTLLSELADTVAKAPVDRQDYNEGVTERWDVEAVREFLADRQLYRSGYKPIADITTRKWRFLSGNGCEYGNYLTRKEKMIAEYDGDYDKYFVVAPKYLELALRAALNARDTEGVLNVWSAITQRRYEAEVGDGMHALAIRYASGVSAMCEAQFMENVELLKAGRRSAVPRSMLPLMIDNYLTHRRKYAQNDPDYPSILTPAYQPVTTDRSNIAAALAQWLKPFGAHYGAYSKELDLAAAYYLYMDDVRYRHRKLQADNPHFNDGYRSVIHHARLQVVAEAIGDVPYAMPREIKVFLRGLKGASR